MLTYHSKNDFSGSNYLGKATSTPVIIEDISEERFDNNMKYPVQSYMSEHEATILSKQILSKEYY